MEEKTEDIKQKQFSYQKVDVVIPNKGMVKDYNPLFQPEDTYTFALNAIKVATNGNIDLLSNEESNVLVASYKPKAPVEVPIEIDPDDFNNFDQHGK